MISKEELLNYIKNKWLTKINSLKTLDILKEKELKTIYGEAFFYYTSFLQSTVSIKERYYCLLNNITTTKMCDICNNIQARFDKNKNIYSICKKCVSKKRSLTFLEKYGCSHALQIKEVKEKIKQTNLIKYGVENVFQNKEIKEKIKNKCLKENGVEYNNQVPKIKEKIKNTNLIKYGVENVFQNKEIKEQIKKKCLNENGVEYNNQVPKVKEKIKNTNLIKFGYENASKNELVKAKIKESCLNNNGVEYPSKCEIMQKKIKQTNLKKFGYESASKSELIKNKTKETNVERYGCNFHTQGHILNKELFNSEYILNNFVSIVYLKKTKQKIKCLDKKAILDFFNITRSTLNIYIKKNKEHFKEIKLNLFNIELEIKKELLNMFPTNLNNEDILLNDRKALENGKELDLYIPKLNIAIEYNGLMFHSFGINSQTRFNNYETENEKKYNHLNKTNMCEAMGIHLFHINENEWINSYKKNIWLNILKQNIEYKLNKLNGLNNLNITTISNTDIDINIKELDYNITQNKETITTFLKNNSLEYYSNIFEIFLISHIKNNIKFLGIYNNKQQKEEKLIGIAYGYEYEYNNVLVEESNKSNNITTFHIEDICFLNQFITMSNINSLETIIFQNISTYFKNHKQNNKINIQQTEEPICISYNLNRRWFSINDFKDLKLKKLNIKEISNLKPKYFYFFKHKIEKLYIKEENLLFDNNTILNNSKLCTQYIYEKGFRKFYDCGYVKYIFTLI
jgi:hypothetical protein